MDIYLRMAGETVEGRCSRTQREEIEGRTRWVPEFESRKEEEHSGREQGRGAYYLVFVSKQRQKKGSSESKLPLLPFNLLLLPPDPLSSPFQRFPPLYLTPAALGHDRCQRDRGVVVHSLMGLGSDWGEGSEGGLGLRVGDRSSLRGTSRRSPYGGRD